MKDARPADEARAERSELGTFGRLWIVAVLVVGAFAPALSAGFLILDDGQNLAFNQSFRGFSAEHLGWMFSTSHMGNYQPVSWLSHALDHALFGLDAAHFHQASVAWHVLVAGLFLVLAERLYARVPGVGASATERGAVRAAALLATLAFALHPLRGESVAWLSGRNDVIAGTFFVLALLAWLRYTREEPRGPTNARALGAVAALSALACGLARSALELEAGQPLALAAHGALLLGLAAASLVAALVLVPHALGVRGATAGAYALAWLAAFLSVLGKAYGIVLPAVLLVLDVWPLGRLRRPSLRASTALRVAEKLPFVALALALAPVTVWSKTGGDLRTLGEHSLVERVWQAFYGLAFYVRKSLVPSGLSPMVDLPAEIRASEPRFLLSIVAVLVVGALLVALRRRFPAALAVALAYAILIAPALGALQAGAQLVADRYSYLASMPLALGFGGLWLGARTRGPLARQLTAIASVTAVLALGLGTWRGAARWADPVALFEHGIASTGSPRLMTNLAMTYNEAAASEREERAELLRLALEWSERAVTTAEALRVLVPVYRLHRGTILHNLGREAEAAADLTWFVERVPTSIEGHLNLGLALARGGAPARAAEAFERCLVLAPTLAPAWRGLGAAAESMGDTARALASYRRALALEPGDPSLAARVRMLESR